jgi:hypothetical protein
LNVRGAARLLLVIALGGAGCGKGVVPGATYDQPLLSFSGTISPTGGLGQAARPMVGLLWTDPLQRRPDVTMPAGWLQSTVNAAEDTFTVDIFRPPPPDAVVDLADATGAISRVAVAELVIVDDQDGDGTFRAQGPRATIAAPDHYLAGSANVLTYVASPFPAQINSPLTLPAQSGYALVNYVCQGQLSAATHGVIKTAVEMILQPSQDFPDVRSCRASHGP